MQRADEDIKKDVIDQLIWDSRIDASKVTVEVEAGAVILSGTVQTPLALRAAIDGARTMDGVRSVENRLDIDYETPATTDDELASRVESGLRWAPEIDADSVQVDVTEGEVTLGGAVPSLWEKRRIVEIAFNVEGVTRVTNRLSVVPTGSSTDRVIADEISGALERNIGADADDIDVTVKNGSVTLSGRVSSWATRHACYDVALFTQGVTHIHDELAVNRKA